MHNFMGFVKLKNLKKVTFLTIENCRSVIFFKLEMARGMENKVIEGYPVE